MLLKKKLKSRPRGRVKGSLIHPKLSVPCHVPGTVLADMRDTEMIQTCSPEGIQQGREGMNINTCRRYPGICRLPSHTFHSLILFPLGTTFEPCKLPALQQTHMLWAHWQNPRESKAEKGEVFQNTSLGSQKCLKGLSNSIPTSQRSPLIDAESWFSLFLWRASENIYPSSYISP